MTDRSAEDESARQAGASGPAAGPRPTAEQVLQLIHAVAAHAGVGPSGGTGTEAGPAGPTAAHVLSALVMLRHLRDELAGWEPQLIAAARELGVSWTDLAPALGVASRQAAERRYLRLRPADGDEDSGTGDERIQAERDRRAIDRAVTEWARQNSAVLRQLAGQVSALSDLAEPAREHVDLVHRALAHDDAARLLPPLAASRSHLRPTHPHLAEQIDVITAHADQLRRDTTARRRSTTRQRS